VYGVRGDPQKAREYYAIAAGGGIQEAKERLKALELAARP
jgi:TPR repeat protein